MAFAAQIQNLPPKPLPPPPAPEQRKKQSRSAASQEVVDWLEREYIDEEVVARNKALALEQERQEVVARLRRMLDDLAERLVVEVQSAETSVVVESPLMAAGARQVSAGATSGSVEAKEDEAEVSVFVEVFDVVAGVDVGGDDD